MTATIQRVAAWLLALQALVHTGFTPAIFGRGISVDAVMFASAGIGWLFLALFNLAQLASSERRVAVITTVANVIGLLMFAALMAVAPGWKVMAALLFTVGCLAGSLTAARKTG
jgi:hypothetical protein